MGNPLKKTWVDEKSEVGTPLKNFFWIDEKSEVGTLLGRCRFQICQIQMVQMAKKPGTLFLSYTLLTQGGAHP